MVPVDVVAQGPLLQGTTLAEVLEVRERKLGCGSCSYNCASFWLIN